MEIKVRVVSNSGVLPAYETNGSAGMDLKAYLEEPIVLEPMDKQLIPTGVFIELPVGYEAQVRARSGLSIKHGITMVNGVGTVDSDYRGELKVPVINLGKETYTINNGDRVAQMIVAKYEKVLWEPVESLTDTKRGQGGFGHTGK